MNDYVDKIISQKKIIKRYIGDERLILRQAIECFKQQDIKNVEVETVEQARSILLSQDPRKLLGLKKQLNVFFEPLIRQDITVKIVAVMPNKDKEVIANYQNKGWFIYGREEKLGRILLEMYKANDQLKACIIYEKNKTQYLFKTVDVQGNQISSFNIIDMYEMAMKVDYYTAIEELCGIYRIKISEIENERELYKKNRDCIDEIFNNPDYSVVKKKLSSYKHLLKSLIDFAEETLYNRSSKRVAYEHIRYILLNELDLASKVKKLPTPITIDQAKRKITQLAEWGFITYTTDVTSYPKIFYFCEYNEMFLKALEIRIERK